MSAVCENYAQVLEETIEPGGKTFFSEIVASISDIKVRQHRSITHCNTLVTLQIKPVTRCCHCTTIR
jgi:hypothetical protein